MPDPIKKIEFSEEQGQIKKTAFFHKFNEFNIHFLQTTLSDDIIKLIELQHYTVGLLDEMIQSLKKRPFDGGSK